MRAHSLSASSVLLTLVLGTFLPLGTSCTPVNKAVRESSEVVAAVVLPPSEEKKLGVQMQAEMQKDLKMHPDPEVQRYVEGLGRKIVQAAREDIPGDINFSFFVVDDPNTVNAFAMPGGYIYIYSGLLLRAESEAEVIGVLGHEVAHVTKRHVAERLVTAYGLQTLLGIAVGENAGQLAQMGASVAGQGYLLKFGRDQERESDVEGLDYVIEAGYNPIGMVTFFQKLAAQGGSPPAFLSSHPNPGDRAEKLRNLIAKRSNLPNKMGKEDFMAMYPKFKSTTVPATAAQ